MRFYVISMIVAAIMSVVMTNLDAVIIIMIFTLGLGFVLFFSATWVVYGACILPIMLARKYDRSSLFFSAVLSVVLIGAVAIFPGLLAKSRAAASTTSLLGSDIRPKAKFQARTMEIRRRKYDGDKIFNDRFSDGESERYSSCGFECRSLLLTGKMNWIRIVSGEGPHGNSSSNGGPSTMFYKSFAGKGCAVPGFPTNNEEKCVLVSSDTGQKADLLMTFEEHSARTMKGSINTFLYDWKYWRRVIVFLQQDSKSVEVLRQTEVKIDVAMTPTVLDSYSSKNNTGIARLTKIEQRINAISFASLLTQLGFDLEDVSGAQLPKIKLPVFKWRNKFNNRQVFPGINKNKTREMLSVLNLDQTARFNKEQYNILSSWLLHARGLKTWSPEQIELLRPIARDRRLQSSISFFIQIFSRHPEVTKALLPDILDRIETEGVGRNTVSRQAAYTFDDIDPSLLKPYSTRLKKLYRKGGDLAKILRPVLVRMDKLQ